MSAFMCGRSHVATIVQYAANTEFRLPSCYPTSAAFANDLLRENARSMDARYGDRWHGDSDYPTPKFRDDAEVLQWARPEYLKPGEVCKAIDCLDYQSCETADWSETNACHTLLALQRHIASAELWRGVATWGIEDKRMRAMLARVQP